MSDAGSTSSDEDAFLKRYEAQTQAATAQTDFWRRAAKWASAGLTVAVVGLVALLIVLIMIARSTHDEGTTTRNKADQVLTLARNLTAPDAQRKQEAAFYGVETAIFRLDCDAKAHQITASNNDLGGHLNLATLQAFCAEIVAPPLP